jgi:phenylalanyl-tRNA synthetase beta chain
MNPMKKIMQVTAMKFSLNSIRGMSERYKCAQDLIPDDIDSLITIIGAQLGGIEEVTRLGAKYEGIVIAKVVSCVDHPNADKLHVCKIDDGGVMPDVERDAQGHVQVVCGAPNVHEGILVAWLPPGTTVPSSYDNDPFVLEARDLRGEKSNGMLASLKELAIGDNHEGITIIDKDVTPGTMFASAFGLENDVIVDIENKMFTHRPDCFGFLGVAREIAGIQNKAFSSPAWYTPKAEIPAAKMVTLPLEVHNELPELVPRFMAVAMAHVAVGPSPLWLQIELAKVGQRSINNIVDYTNFFMLETGQPLHAYDYDKVKALDPGSAHATLSTRYPREGEKLNLLNGKEITPRSEAILIATGTAPIGLAGVMGGADTEVTATTTNIILECATFNMYSIRRTSMFHGLFTDAVTRFNKGQSPLQNQAVLAKIVSEITQFAGGEVASIVSDDVHLSDEVLATQSLHVDIGIPASFVTSRLGRNMAIESMASMLEHVEFGVETQDDHLMIRAPFWRTDIEIPEDIVEEVGRLYGFDKVPLQLPMRSIKPVEKDKLIELKARLRNTLARAGANEVLTYSFVHGNLLATAGQNKDLAYKLTNALSPDLQYYRTSLVPSLLDKIHINVKAGYDSFAIFELGKVHVVGLEYEGHPIELERLAFVYTANEKAAKQLEGAPFYYAKTYVETVLSELGIQNEVKFLPLDPPAYLESTAEKIPFFEVGRTAIMVIDNINIGEVGEFKAGVRSGLKLPSFTAGFDLDVGALLNYADRKKSYTALPRFPRVTQDMTLKVPTELSYIELHDFVIDELGKVKPKNSSLKIEPLGIFQKPEDPANKQVTLRITVVSYEKTLTDSEVNRMLDSVAAVGKQQLKSERV